MGYLFGRLSRVWNDKLGILHIFLPIFIVSITICFFFLNNAFSIPLILIISDLMTFKSNETLCPIMMSDLYKAKSKKEITLSLSSPFFTALSLDIP